MGGWFRRGFVALGLMAAFPASTLAMISPSAASASASPQVTIAEAQHVYETIWHKFGVAFVEGDLGTLENLATPQVIDVVAASTGCGCSWETLHSKAVFSIPPRTGFPESFLAQISTPVPRHSSYSPFVTMVVFTKSAARAPWRVAYFGRYAGTMKYLKRTLTRQAPPALFDIDQVPTQIANFFTAMVTSGTPPPGDNWPDEGMIGEELQSYLDAKSSIRAGGDQQQTVFSAVDHSIAFAYPKGDIMCATYDSYSTVTPLPGQPPMAQPEDESYWGEGLAPGIYSSISKRGMHDMCFSVDTVDNSHSDRTGPISFQGGVYEMSGIPTQLAVTVPPISGT
jgi:hypothetical protein